MSAAGPRFHDRPVLVFWETTRACGLACQHCRASAIAEPLPGELSASEGLALVDELATFTPRPPVLVLTGGDPLRRVDLFDLIHRARERGLPVAVAPAVTSELTPQVIDRLVDAGVASVSVSLDGAVAATHEGIRGVPGHLEQTIAAVDALVAAGLRVQVNTTVMRRNVRELPAVAALLLDHGVRVWEVFFLIHIGRGTRLQQLAPHEVEDVAHLLVDASTYGLTVRTVEAPSFRRVAAWRAEGRAMPGLRPGRLYEELTTDLAARLGLVSGRPQAGTLGTRDGKGILFVGYDGAVTPAGFLPVELGNVRQRSIVDIYRQDPLLRAIRDARFSGRCGRCDYRDLCGGSRARAYAATGDPLAEDPSCAYVPG